MGISQQRTRLADFERPWCVGGTIATTSVQDVGWYAWLRAAGFEDGTVDYLGLPAVTLESHDPTLMI